MNLIIFLLFLSCNSDAQKNNFNSGDYDDILHLAIDRSKSRISGYISYNPYEGDQKSVQIECKIFFEGTTDKSRRDNYFNINLYSLGTELFDRTKGEIKIDSNKVFLKIGNDYPSCSSVLDFTGKDGALFILSKRVGYKYFNLIKSPKAVIYFKPEDTCTTKKYLIKSDVVNVIDSKGKFTLVEFYGTKTTKGWIRNDDLFFTSIMSSTK